MHRDPVFGEYMDEDQLRYLGSIHHVVGGYEYRLLCQTLDDYQDSGESLGVWKLFDEVHQDRGPQSGWYQQLFQLPLGLVPCLLCTSACGTGGHIVFHNSSESPPMEVAVDDSRHPSFSE